MNGLITNLAHRLAPTLGASHHALTVSSVAVDTLSVSLAEKTQYLLVQVTGAQVRQTVNGTAPTTALGFIRPSGWEAIMSLAEWRAAKWITQGPGDAILQIGELTT